MEVAAREHRLIGGEHQRIVGARVELDLQDSAEIIDRIGAGAMHLGRAAKRVRVLHPVAEHVRFGDPASLG